ncbi:hypothetical protein A3L25_006535 [Pseudomonas putida]|jgi:hypothetical protein|uniref:Uncharacterized protein n=2 Tax=Pseudomonas putida TaxID=303 RepID=A0A7H5QZJ7_PSEPU|nr:hypothetical protein [Pseudomonas putida]KAF0250754.1 hypothetical protein GN299_32315 [Pseudomonas putida]MBS5848188.1 hypothetical protein [Pseudomonas putida]QJQ09097.1 hypothetical protein A3L25_006535 [Pseudomonas putida]UPU93623.1 hypothetical protein M0766_04150 [Pseudomonas putida]WQE55415.1 hypothetical protein U0028_06980 [Pseudomonas putida]
MPVTSLRKACVRPPEVAKIKSKIKSQIKSKIKSKIKSRINSQINSRSKIKRIRRGNTRFD